jgi:hypothetical protein
MRGGFIPFKTLVNPFTGPFTSRSKPFTTPSQAIHKPFTALHKPLHSQKTAKIGPSQSFTKFSLANLGLIRPFIKTVIHQWNPWRNIELPGFAVR